MKFTQEGNYLNIKGLTYLFLIIFLASAGAVISGPDSGEKCGSKAGSVFQKLCKPVLLENQIRTQTNRDDRENNPGGYPSTKKEFISYIPINYLLSEPSFGNNINSGRTSIWFTSRIKN